MAPTKSQKVPACYSVFHKYLAAGTLGGQV